MEKATGGKPPERMIGMDLCDIRTVRRVMADFGLTFRKEFGQNFLTDRGVIEAIAEAGSGDGKGTVLEIGPGIGTLTRELAARSRRVIALEIDRALIPVLGVTLADCPNVTVRNEDVMKSNLTELLAEAFREGEVSVCANLPYYITSPILMKLLESGLPFRTVTVLVQKEFADRLTAPPGGKEYGSITATAAYYGAAECLMQVPADRFVPAPKVDSTVVRIRLYGDEKPFRPKDEKAFFATVRAAFLQRRKTLTNALANGLPGVTKEQVEEAIRAIGYPPDVRGERLKPEDFAKLSDLLL